MSAVAPEKGAKMMFLIRRKPDTSREELVAHWFKNHMPAVIDHQVELYDKGRAHAWRYHATLFDADAEGEHAWDGVAQLWYDKAWPRPSTPIGVEPTDTFQQKAEPYMSWATTEYVYLDGELPVEPLTLNEAFPITRSGFYKIILMAAIKEPSEHETFVDYWLNNHAPRAADRLKKAGALRYVVSISQQPDEHYAGMAELYFENAQAAAQYLSNRESDELENWMDADRTLVLRARTEMIGIP